MLAFFGRIGMGMVVELKTVMPEMLLMDLHFFMGRGKEVFQNPAVAQQGAVHIPDVVVVGTFQPVVMGAPAVIVAEFFVRPARKGFVACQAVLNRGSIHSVQVDQRLEQNRIRYKITAFCGGFQS